MYRVGLSGADPAPGLEPRPSKEAGSSQQGKPHLHPPDVVKTCWAVSRWADEDEEWEEYEEFEDEYEEEYNEFDELSEYLDNQWW
ncbi:MAG: hypothetical protein QXO46_07685 [Nitrososphaerota archaeon]